MAHKLTVDQARRVVLLRDGSCKARDLDEEAGECGDIFGLPLSRYSGPGILEMDRIRTEAGAKPGDHTDPFRMVALCPRHHRGVGDLGGRVWATSHRGLLRAYLDRPQVQEGTRRLLLAV